MAYDSTNRRTYVDTANGIGISIDEVSKCLARATLDLGQLCADKAYNSSTQTFYSANRINKAAKYKPVRLRNAWSTEGNPQLESTWWKGSDGNCGLYIYRNTSLLDFVNKILYTGHTDSNEGYSGDHIVYNGVVDFSKNPLDWTYMPPRGYDAYPMDVEPFRLLDFDHYNHRAVFTKPRLWPDGKRLEVNRGPADQLTDIYDSSLYTIDFPNNITYSDGGTLVSESLGLNDIQPGGTTSAYPTLADYYMGIILVKQSNPSLYAVGVAADTLGSFVSGWAGMTFYGAVSLVGNKANEDLAMVPFLSSVTVPEEVVPGTAYGPYDESTLSQDDIYGNFISCFGLSPVTAYVHRNGFVDLEIGFGNKQFPTGADAGNLLGTISITVCSGPITEDTLYLYQVTVGLEHLINSEYVDMGVGFTTPTTPTREEIPLTPSTDEYQSGAIILNTTNHSIYLSREDDGFIPGDTYRLSLKVTHSNPTEVYPNTPDTVYSSGFTIG